MAFLFELDSRFARTFFSASSDRAKERWIIEATSGELKIPLYAYANPEPVEWAGKKRQRKSLDLESGAAYLTSELKMRADKGAGLPAQRARRRNEAISKGATLMYTQSWIIQGDADNVYRAPFLFVEK